MAHSADSDSGAAGTPPSQEPRRAATRLTAWIACLVALAAWITGSGALDGGFVLDDVTYVLKNRAVIGAESPWTHPTPPDRPELGLYRPLTVATYRAQFSASGLDPVEFRRVNLALHALAAALVVLLTRRLGGNPGVAAFAGLLFATHPVHAEAVGWIVGRAELLATVFALGALLVRPPSGARFFGLREGAMVVAYLAAASSKESALALPLVLLAFDHFEGVERSTRLRRFVLLCAAAAAVIALRYAVLGRFSPEVSEHPQLRGLEWTQRAELAVRILGLALTNLAWPTELSIYYEPRRIGGWLPLTIGVGTLVALWFLLRSRHDEIARKGAIVYIAGIVPVLHLVPIAWLFGDRFLYLPSVGFALVAASIGSRVLRPGMTRALIAAVVLLTCTYFWIARLPVFSSDLSLWRDAVAKDSESGFAHHQVAGLLKDAGRFEYVSDAERGAVHHWTESLRVEPDHLFAARSHLELGHYALTRLNDAATAAHHYRATIELDPQVRTPEGIDARLALASLGTREAGMRESGVSEANAIFCLREVARGEPNPTQRNVAAQLLERLKDSKAFDDGGVDADALRARFVDG